MNVDGMEEAQRLAQSAMTPRAKWLDRLDRYVKGTQYEGKPSFWDTTVPTMERQPCVTYNVTKSALKGFKANITAEDKFPDVTARGAWDLDEKVLTDEDAKSIDQVFASLAKMAKFQSISGEVLPDAMGQCSAAVIFGIRSKKLCLDTVRASWCLPEFDKDGQVTRLEIKYSYIDTNLIINGRCRARAMWYRRVVDDKNDTIYKTVEFKSLTEKITWVEDVVNKHNFGFCPVRWYAFEKGASIAGRIDGHAIHEELLQDLDALNMLLSVKHRAALMSEGQWTEIGVSEGYNPTDAGRAPHVLIPSSPMGGIPTPDNPVSGGYKAYSGTPEGRKKGLGEVWQYTGGKTDVQVELHSMPGDALKAMADCAMDERNKLGELLSMVFIDPENLPKGAAMSGTAIMAIRKRFFERCDEIRLDFGDNFIIPAYGMMLRIAQKVNLPVPGMTKAMEIVKRMGELWSYDCPPLQLSWGDYAALDPTEGLALAQTVTALVEAKLITSRIAVKMLRGIMGIEDIDAYLEELDEHNTKMADQEQEQGLTSSDDEHGKALELQDQKLTAQTQQVKIKAASVKSKPTKKSK